MQVLKDDFYSNRLRIDGGPEDEHQALVEEQQSGRARARKFSLETNRRRKALEDRRKRWDIQEERLRETILQQRKQRVQDATERFQRAHLPPSQRRRPSFRKNTPNIEEALIQLQGPFIPYSRQSSFLSSSSTLSRSCTPSPKPPPGPSPSRHQRTLSAVEAYTKLMQERTVHSFRNSQMLFLSELQETQVKGHPVNQSHDSESLSSLDSLENEEVNHNNDDTTNPNHNNITDIASSSHSSLGPFEVRDLEKPQSDQKNKAGFGRLSDQTLPSTKYFSNGLLQHSQAYPSHPPNPWEEEPKEPNKRLLPDPPPTTRGPNFIEKSLIADAQPPLSTLGLLALCGIAGAAQTERCYQNSQENNPNDRITAFTQSKATPDNTPLEFARLPQDWKIDYRQYVMNQEDRYSYSNHPSATKIVLHTKNYNHRDDLCETHGARETAVAQQTAIELTDQSHESNEAMNNLNKGTDRSRHTEPINQTCKANLHARADIPACRKRPEDETPELSSGDVISGSGSKIGDFRLIKGILKKQSKYVPGDAKTRSGAGHSIFTKQVALSIRDSVELTRTKVKSEEANRVVKKKLRWFDEVNLEEEEKEINTNVNQQKSVYPLEEKGPSSLDHQQSVIVAPGGPCVGPGTTPPASTGYHFTKQAWTDVGVQDGKLRGQREVKVQQASTRAGGPRVRSARVGPGLVSSRLRKGAVIRPQSASEASHIARSQGKVMVPRPPPRTETTEVGVTGDAAEPSTKSLYAVDPSGIKQGLPVKQALYGDNMDCPTPPHAQAIRTDSAVVFIQYPPSYAHLSPESSSRGSAPAGQLESQGSAGRSSLYNEKGQCLDHTPTDEEISQLWHGVRSALATKDARANLSHVTINGDSLISGVKTATRKGGFFLSPTNARNLVRKQAPESAGARRRGVEPGRQAPGGGGGAAAWRFPLPTQSVFQINPCPSKYDLTQLHDGADSAAQFQLVEPPGEELLVDAGMAAAMETQRPPQGLTSLSLEEQKVLQSLDRLNHRLHYVREFVGGHAAASGGAHVDMPYAGEGKALRKQRGVSADSRPRTQRRF